MTDKKKTTLNSLIEDLSPEKIEAIERRHAGARNKFTLKDIDVKNRPEFKEKVISYMKHHHKHTLLDGKAGPELSDEDALSQAYDILDTVYKKQGGSIYAYDIARKGKLGDVLNTLAAGMSAEQVGKYEKFIKDKIDPQDFEMHKSFVKEFKSKYKEFIPKGMKTKSDEEMALRYNALIEHHLEHQQKIQDYFKPYEPEKKKEEKKKAA